VSLKDVRIPADASDKQTTDAKTAKPPREFNVTKAGGTNTITITDRQAVQDRATAAKYRIYFCPSQFTPTAIGLGTLQQPAVSDPTKRLAARKVASLVTSIEAPGLGTNLTYSDATNFGKAGYYFCVAVNRSGVESPPQHMIGAPI
jgi:hypothetical protein